MTGLNQCMIPRHPPRAHDGFDKKGAPDACSFEQADPMTKTIAVVDDDASVRIATQNLVRSMGWAVQTFASAEDFLAGAPMAGIDCLITDVQMEGLGGVELAATLLSRGFAIPVIFITAFPDERVRARAMAAGGVDFFAKPFDGQQLINCIERALRH